MASKRIIEIGENDVLTPTAAKSAVWQLGDVAYCEMNGQLAQFRYSRNRAVASLTQGMIVRQTDLTVATYRSISNVYTATNNKYGLPSVKLDAAAVSLAVAEDEFSGMSLLTTFGAGRDQCRTIMHNDAATASSGYLTVYVNKPFDTALVAADDVQVLAMDYVQKTSAAADVPAGIVPCTVADAYFFWRQVTGLALVLVHDGTTTVGTVGAAVICSTTAGTGAFGGSETASTPASRIISLQKMGTGDTMALCKINLIDAI
jgi:hypothetical protein